jgi:hypothetical protein
MNDTTCNIDATKFLFFAGKNYNRWLYLLQKNVSHKEYGSGIVVGINRKINGEYHLEIEFERSSDDLSMRTFNSKYFTNAKFNKLELPIKLCEEIESYIGKINPDGLALQVILQDIHDHLENNNLQEAKELYSVSQCKLSQKIKSDYQKQIDAKVKIIVSQIEYCLAKEDYIQANTLLDIICEFYPVEGYYQIVNDYKFRKEQEQKIQLLKTRKNEIINYLKVYDFDKAESIYLEIKDDFSRDDYDQLVEKYKQQQDLDKKIEFIRNELKIYNFPGADKSFHELGLSQKKNTKK